MGNQTHAPWGSRNEAEIQTLGGEGGGMEQSTSLITRMWQKI